MNNLKPTHLQLLPLNYMTYAGMTRWLFLTLCIMSFSFGALAQGVGIGTNSPAASAVLDVYSGNQGVLFPRMSSADREAIDPAEYGLMVYDTTRRMMFIFEYDNNYGEGMWKPMDPFWIELEPGRIVFEGVSIDGTSLGELFKIQAVQRQTAAELQTSGDGFAYPTYGLLTSVFNNTLLDKTGGRFNVWSSGTGGGRKTGVKSYAFGTHGENIGIHADVEGDSAVNRAAWFERGDVVIEDRVLIGADTVYDEADPSALLELRSDSSGLLLPRLTTAQRDAIPTPAEGLHVYDTDLHKTYYFNGGTWEPVEGTGGMDGSSPWNDSANGIYYSSGNVGISTVASADIKLDVNQVDEPIGLHVYSVSSTSDNLTGIYSYLSATGNGVQTGILGQVNASTSSTSSVYGVRGEAYQSTSNGNVYGIYGSATGTGTGLRWAGYFDNNVNVATQMRIGGGNFIPHESALLELSSTDKGLLLPRMTTAQRLAISPLTDGLVVFDTDSLDAYVYGGGGGWNPMGGSSSAPGLWSEVNGFGIYYEDGLVGIGGLPLGNTTMSIDVDNEDTGLYLFQSSISSATKYGIKVEHSGAASGDNYGTYSKVTANSSSSNPSYGVYGEVFQGSSPGPAYGVYGKVVGTGIERWAGYFDGQTKVTGTLNASAQIQSPLITLGAESGIAGVVSVKNQSNDETIRLNGSNGRMTTKELEITGGSDMAEYFSTKSSSGIIAPGSVVVIDTENPGMVKLSSHASDKRVVGVVSGANGIKPGMLMGQRESIAFGDMPIAIAGRVYVRTDDSGGEIEPGDFLTTSFAPGKARKVTDWDAARGAILGKALTYVDDDGFVLILVNLQ